MTSPQSPVAGSRRPLLVGLLTSVVAVAFEAVAVATAMPRAGQQLGQIGLYGWAFTLFVLGMVASTAVAGRISDRVGPVWPLLVGTAIFLLGLVLSGTATTMLQLVAGRFVQGLGGGAMNLTLMVVVALVFDEATRARVMTAFSFCWVMPAFVGPFVAGWLTDHLSWHWVFWSVVPVLLASVALSAPRLLRLHAEHTPPPADELSPVPVWAAVVAALGAAGLQFGGQELNLVGLGVGVLALAALLVAVPRLMPPRFVRVATGLPAVVWTRALQAGAFFATEAFLPLSLVRLRHLTVTEAGLWLTIGSVGWTLGSWLQSRSWLPLRRDRIIVVGAALVASGVALVCLFAWRPGVGLAVPGAAWGLAGLGMGLGTASTSLATMALSDATSLGRNTSSLQVGEGLGNALCAGIGGSIFHVLQGTAPLTHTFGWVFVVGSVAGLGAVASALRIGPVRNASHRSAG